MARYRDNCPLDCKVYVGELGNNGTRHELEEAFGYYGPLRNVWVARNPPGFAFVMFEDNRDARDAVRALNGKIICGRRIRAELSTGKTRREMNQMRYGRSPIRSPRRSPVYRDRERGYSPRRRDYSPRRSPRSPRRGDYRGNQRYRSRSRSRSLSPVGRRDGRGDSRSGYSRNHSRTPPSRSRSPRSPSKSPRTPTRYR